MANLDTEELNDTWKDPKHFYSLIPKPVALTHPRWNQWEVYVKEKYPIRYFLQETLPDFFCNIKNKINNAWWWILYRIHPKHRYHMVNTGLKPGYYDPDILLIYSTFNILHEFVKECIENPIVDWEAEEESKRIWEELITIDTWWTFDRPERENQFEQKHPFPDVDRLDIFDKEKQNDPKVKEYRKALDLYSKAKEEWHKEDEEYLIRLIKVRRYLWT